MNKILITGGSGFIGTNVIEYYKNTDNKILNIDVALPQISEHQIFWQQHNIMDAEGLKKIIVNFQPSHVIHLAARTDLNGKSPGDYNVNTIGTENLINALKEITGLKRVIFTSSMLVCKVGYIPAGDMDFAPSTIYGESKMEMELLIRGMHLPYQWNIIRPTSIWGPWFKSPYRDFFDRVISKKMFNIKKKACTKTYGFVLNSVYQIDKLLFHKGNNEESVYYIGDQPPLNISEWANLIALQLGHKPVPEVSYGLLNVAAKCGDVLKKAGIKFPITSFRLHNMTTDNILPSEKFYSITGQPPYNLTEGIEITLNWLRST